MSEHYVHFEINGQEDRRTLAGIFADNGYPVQIEKIKHEITGVIEYYELIVGCSNMDINKEIK